MPAGNTASPLDLTTLDLDALQALRDAVDERMAHLEAERREAGFLALEEIARRHGLSKAEIAARFGARRRRKAGNGAQKNPVRYRNPENPRETWTGRGRRPNWVEAQLATGKALEELRAVS